jgi:acyl-CoA hydrolase
MKIEKKTYSSTEVRMTELMTPEHANFLGNVFGGTILALMDKCAYVTASRFAGRVCVTAGFDRIDFHSPIAVGELVHVIGRVIYVGKTSVQVVIEVHAEDIHNGATRHTNSCYATMVAIDDARKPVDVPRLSFETREDKLRFLEGRLRRELREKQSKEQEEALENLQNLSDEDLEKEINK